MRNRAILPAMHLIPDVAAFQKRFGALPVETYKIGETVLAGGSRTGRLLILKKGTVTIIKDSIKIAEVTEPGAVFGEISALLDQPHTADVYATETSQFHVADAALAVQDPIVLLYVAAVLARRLDGANQALIDLKGQLQAGQPPSMLGKTIERIEGLLGPGANLAYAGYPYDPHS
jgi:CRP/FNR family cyclic AMP-dependent transcriptional regulator